MARVLGDAVPDLAKRYGLDQFQREQLEEALGDADSRVKLVLLQEPPPRPDGKTDPIAYLPPTFRTYGIVDRDHRQRVSPGEAWFVEVVDRSGAFFLVPLAKFEVAEVGAYMPGLLDQVAQRIAREHPEVLRESVGQEQTRELEDLRARLAASEADAGKAREELGLLRAEAERLEAELAKGAPAIAAPSAPATTPPLEAKAPGTARATSNAAPAAAPSAPSATTAAHGAAPSGLVPPAALARDGVAVRERGDVLVCPLFHHAAYEAHFTLDLARLHLRPSRHGLPAVRGAVEVPGLTRVDAEAAPRRYHVAWSDEAGAWVVGVGRGTG